MAELTDELIDQVFEGCRSNIADLTQSLGTNLSGEFELTPGEEVKGSVLKTWGCGRDCFMQVLCRV